MLTINLIKPAKNMLAHLALVSLAIAFSLCSAGRAEAATINTYNFTQGGYQNGFSLYGSFTGIVENNGRIELADLLNSALYFGVKPADGVVVADQIGITSSVVFFTFDTTGSASTLAFKEILVPPGVQNGLACVGAAAAFGLCDVKGGFPGVVWSVASDKSPITTFSTPEFPTITLVSSEEIAAPVSSTPAAVPIPSALALFGPAITSLLLSVRRRKVA